MRRVVVRRAGGLDRLELVEEPDPVPGPDEVLVEVEAIGVNYADCMVRMGLYKSAQVYVGWPITPGFEVAGWCEGRRVIAVTRFGGYTSHLVVPRSQVFDLPDDIDFVTAAGVPTVFMTAWWAVHELAHPRPGHRVLIHSAAGGVGGALIQLCKAAGCEVVGVVGGSHKVATAEALGATVIDTSTQDLWTEAERIAPDGFHHIFDANGVKTLRASYDHLASPGKLVVYGFATMVTRGKHTADWPRLAVRWLRSPTFDPLAMTGDNRSVLAFNLSYLFEEQSMLAEAMTDLLGRLRSGAITPLTTTSYPLDRVPDAHRDLERGGTTGKLILVP